MVSVCFSLTFVLLEDCENKGWIILVIMGQGHGQCFDFSPFRYVFRAGLMVKRRTHKGWCWDPFNLIKGRIKSDNDMNNLENIIQFLAMSLFFIATCSAFFSHQN